MKRWGSVALLVAAVSLAGCEKKVVRTPGVFDVSVSEAYRRLSTNDLAELIFRRQCGILIHIAPVGAPESQVTWWVTSSDQNLMQFTAVLTPISATQTKVDIRMPADPDGGELYDGDKFYRRPAFNQPLRPAVEEQVAAILEGRPFDVTRLGPGRDTVCNAQRGALESGARLRIDDPPDA